jgi:RhtB (resistance to homoserine/threonine) family protein
MIWAFLPVALLVTITPGAATAMVLRSALRDGWRAGVLTIAGNEIGVLTWALLSLLGVSALIAASEIAFAALKIGGAAVLVYLGIQSLRRSRRPAPPPAPLHHGRRRALRDGLVTALANPKLAVFFVALFPQFVEQRSSVVPTTLLMAALIVIFDFVWYTGLALAASRARRRFESSALSRWLERTAGAVLVALGVRVAFESR